MSVHFPDLQVLLPRADELARAASPAQQQDGQQAALAQAALQRSERERTRVSRPVKSEGSDRTRRERSPRGSSDRSTPRHPRGKGRRIDVDA